MQYTSFLVVLAAITPGIRALAYADKTQDDPVHTFNVYNHCNYEVFYNSILHSVPPGRAEGTDSGSIAAGGAFHEAYPDRKGRSVQLGRSASLKHPLLANYSFNNTQIYFELIGGSDNPFIAQYVDYSAVSPASFACTPFECSAYDYDCYSTGFKGSGQKVYSCSNVNNHLTLNLCDPHP